ncbi:hypothetical protein KP509_29G071400 [Ceratopteris richardii]|nr:hypothetical protein KP509_29G071400 [Ceratopteris richardii]
MLNCSSDGSDRPWPSISIPSGATSSENEAIYDASSINHAEISRNRHGHSASRLSSTWSSRSANQSAKSQSALHSASNNRKGTDNFRRLVNESMKRNQGKKGPDYTKRPANQIVNSLARPKDNDRQLELCKDCKASIMESVCFINNDGRIAAALTGTVHAHNLRHCRKPGCAANHDQLKYRSEIPPLPKRQPAARPMDAQQSSKLKSRNRTEVSNHFHHSSSVSSIQESDCQSEDIVESKKSDMATVTLSLERNSEATQATDTGVSSLSSLSPRLSGASVQNSYENLENQQNHEEHCDHVESGTPSPSCTSLNIHDRDDEEVWKDLSDEQYNLKSICYHGDNEYSCSEDGTDATNTPNSVIKGAFDNNSILDVEDDVEGNKFPPKKSLVAWMRQRYLESLKDQEAETVRLRRQEIMTRKQAEDWMLDCHMEELLHKLAPNGEARVKVLVEAFETVIHCSDSESSQQAH